MIYNLSVSDKESIDTARLLFAKMSIAAAISDLFHSFYELIASFFGTAYALVHSLLTAIFGFISGLFTLAGDILGGFVDITTGVGKFVVGK